MSDILRRAKLDLVRQKWLRICPLNDYEVDSLNGYDHWTQSVLRNER